MSIGPHITTEDVLKEKITTKVSRSIKKSAEVYFKDPMYYLFHICLFATAASFVLGFKVAWQMYPLLALLAFFSIKGEEKDEQNAKS